MKYLDLNILIVYGIVFSVTNTMFMWVQMVSEWEMDKNVKYLHMIVYNLLLVFLFL